MKINDIMTEASYPGNIGAMEVFKFYQTASEDEKETFEELLNQERFDGAWELIQSVTGVRLHPMDDGRE